jgi:hypothetical protein
LPRSLVGDDRLVETQDQRSTQHTDPRLFNCAETHERMPIPATGDAQNVSFQLRHALIETIQAIPPHEPVSNPSIAEVFFPVGNEPAPPPSSV